MSSEVLKQIVLRLVDYNIVAHVEFVRTKVRAHLIGNYILDIYFNKTLGKYSYTMIKENKRIMRWDNAPHHTTHS